MRAGKGRETRLMLTTPINIRGPTAAILLLLLYPSCSIGNEDPAITFA